MSKVFCPLLNIAAAMNMAFEILKGNNSIAYAIHAPPKSCPTKITCMNRVRKFQNMRKETKPFSVKLTSLSVYGTCNPRRGNPDGKVHIEQYLLAVDLSYYIYQAMCQQGG